MSPPSPEDPLAPALAEGLASMALPLDELTQRRLLQYLRLIAQWNRVYNLTAVREPAAMLTQHLLDCLAIIPPLRRHFAAADAVGEGRGDGSTLLDVGSGAGLPGVVIAICEPAWRVTCVDTVAKKTSFIRQVAVELGLSNLEARHERVEAMRDSGFDVVTSRAFASLADFVNLTRDRLGQGGCWLAMKAQLSSQERAGLPSDVEVFHVEPLRVPSLDAARCLVWMRPPADA
ncbi:16S rRNA (guanine(527)-N(7))-methyltransferase RsmG [Ideonella sp. YS5]|uniref:16S rRNA (guanine(527)-N(7))-methyltransferase RsmG n=1 Tax=Ideonella sp. YS5 TaxID=3453714 RepID=UPI003EEBFE2F